METAVKPAWLKIKIPFGQNYTNVLQSVKSLNLHTVCEEACCPNIAECWGCGTATIMIMGDTCTRACKFCSVTSGRARQLDSAEPERVALAIKAWELKYAVITSVCRDDLYDSGADHMARTISAIRLHCPKTIVEALIPDFRGSNDSLKTVSRAKPHVLSHNIETVRRLTPIVRDVRASYDQSLTVLRKIKQIDSSIYTKSSIMLGLAETEQEILETAENLREVGVDILTMGQYLQPSKRHLPVAEYVAPAKFEYYKQMVEQIGFRFVVAGPFVRSSYKAGEFFSQEILLEEKMSQSE